MLTPRQTRVPTERMRSTIGSTIGLAWLASPTGRQLTLFADSCRVEPLGYVDQRFHVILCIVTVFQFD